MANTAFPPGWTFNEFPAFANTQRCVLPFGHRPSFQTKHIMDTPNQNQPQIQQTVVVVGKQKSVGVAFLLAFLFGPLGLLYASITGGIVMFILGIIIGIITFGLGLILVWVGSIIWAVVAANNANKNMGARLKINTSFGGQTLRQQQPVPIQQTQPQVTTVETSNPLIANTPQQISNSNQPSFDLAQWFDKNKKTVLIGAGSIIGLLILIIAIKFVLSIDFSNKDKSSTTSNQQPTNNATNSSQTNDNSFKETPATTTYVQRQIPKPLVPIIKAANVLPKWTQSEEIDGEYILIGFYVGAIGKKSIKLSIVGVDTTNNHVVGFSSVNGNRVDFEGTYTLRLRKASTNQASNIIDFNTYVFNLSLFEPDGINTNGFFQIELDVTDAQGSSGTGSWTSYSGKLYREVSVTDTYLAQEQ